MSNSHSYNYLSIEYLSRFAGAIDETEERYSVNIDFIEFVRSFSKDRNAVEYMMSNFPGDLALINTICRETPHLQMSIIRRHADKFFSNHSTKHFLSLYHRKTKDFVEEFHDRINWTILSIYGDMLDAQEIDNCAEYLDWKLLCQRRNLEAFLIRKHADKIDWETYCKYREIPSRILVEFHDRIIWHSVWHMFSPSFVRRHGDIVDWDDIALNASFSISFFKNNKNRLKPELVSQNKISQNRKTDSFCRQ